MPPASFAVGALLPDDGTTQLSLGAKQYTPLKTFIRKHAKDYESKLLARTYVLVDEQDAEKAGRIWGYITLVASEVETIPQNRPAETHWPDGYHIPAVKLARMAIDKELQRQGLGESIVSWALGLVTGQVASLVGCRLLVTDAKNDAVAFYEKMGFTILDTETNKQRDSPVMFIQLDKVRAA